jgi:hypothetical protein
MQIESQKRYRTFLIIVAYIIMAMSGVSYASAYYINSPDEFLYTIILALVLTNICIVDSKVSGKPLSILNYWIVFIFYGIAVPVCIIRSHGMKGIAVIFIHLIGLVLVLSLSSYITWLLLK